MTEKCAWCDKGGIWLQWVDNSPADAMMRLRGYPGPTSTKVVACGDHKELLDRDRFHPEHRPVASERTSHE